MSESWRSGVISSVWERFEFLRFSAVGMLSATIYVVFVYIFCVYGGLSETVGGALAYLVAIPVNFFGQKRATFRSKKPARTEIFPYIILHATNIAASSTVLNLSDYFFGNIAIGILLVILTVTVITYFLSKRIFR